jgi:flagellar biosynthesis/type III secretory pathway chaperone
MLSPAKELLRRILVGYRGQYELYGRLFRLTQARGDADLDELGELIERTQDVMERLDVLQAHIDDSKKALGDLLGLSELTLRDLKEAFGDVKELEDILGKLISLLEDIKRLEEENQARCERRIAQVKGDLLELHKGQAATSAYTGEQLGEARFIDRKS